MEDQYADRFCNKAYWPIVAEIDQVNKADRAAGGLRKLFAIGVCQGKIIFWTCIDFRYRSVGRNGKRRGYQVPGFAGLDTPCDPTDDPVMVRFHWELVFR